MSSNTCSKSPAASSKKLKREHQQKQPRASITCSADEREWFFPFTRGDPLYIDYMTNEWGREKETDRELFEKLSLEGAQSGLSWRTILHKREAYRRAFCGFDVERVAAMTGGDVDELLSRTSDDPSELVVRHRGKLESVINNAKVIRELKDGGVMMSFKEYLWSFVDGQPILNRWRSFGDIPSKTDESERMSRALRAHGFKFVGPTTCYALMQSCGLVIDHPVGTRHWGEAERRLKQRKGGYQLR